ncbi:MAG: 2OG-Fe(II) oxygenase [Myxococcaceae bacterium]
MRDALLSSPLVGRSTLAGPFQSSRGFAVIFKQPGRAEVEQRFPALRPWLDATLGRPAVQALTPWWRRVSAPIPNAWYLNVLLVSEGGTVGRHVDATLRKPAGVDDAIPVLVSVLYLNVPDATGGELQLWQDGHSLALLRPRPNQGVHFRGDLSHEVRPFAAGTGQLRASLVIEQYHFAPDALARLPDFKLDSKAGFGAYLEHHASLTSGAPRGDLDTR